MDKNIMLKLKLLVLFVGVLFVVALTVIGIVLVDRRRRGKGLLFFLGLFTVLSIVWMYSIEPVFSMSYWPHNKDKVEELVTNSDESVAKIDYVVADFLSKKITGCFYHDKNEKYNIFYSQDDFVFHKAKIKSNIYGKTVFYFDYDSTFPYTIRIICSGSDSVTCQEMKVPAATDYFAKIPDKPAINKVLALENDITIFFEGPVDATNICVSIFNKDGVYSENYASDIKQHTFCGKLNDKISIKPNETYSAKVKYIYEVDQFVSFIICTDEKIIKTKE